MGSEICGGGSVGGGVCGGGSVGGEVRGGVWEVKQVEECGR